MVQPFFITVHNAHNVQHVVYALKLNGDEAYIAMIFIPVKSIDYSKETYFSHLL